MKNKQELQYDRSKLNISTVLSLQNEIEVTLQDTLSSLSQRVYSLHGSVYEKLQQHKIKYELGLTLPKTLSELLLLFEVQHNTICDFFTKEFSTIQQIIDNDVMKYRELINEGLHEKLNQQMSFYMDQVKYARCSNEERIRISRESIKQRLRHEKILDECIKKDAIRKLELSHRDHITKLNKDHNMELDLVRSEVKEVQEANSIMNRKYDETHINLLDSKREISRLRKEKIELQQRIAENQLAFLSSKGTRNSIREIDIMKQTIEDHRKELKKVSSLYNHAQEENEKYKAEIKLLQEFVNKNKEEITVVQNLLKQAKSELISSAQEKDQLYMELRISNEEIKSLEDEIVALLEREKDCLREIEEREILLSNSHQTISMKTKELVAYRAKVLSLESSLEEAMEKAIILHGVGTDHVEEFRKEIEENFRKCTVERLEESLRKEISEELSRSLEAEVRCKMIKEFTLKLRNGILLEYKNLLRHLRLKKFNQSEDLSRLITERINKFPEVSWEKFDVQQLKKHVDNLREEVLEVTRRNELLSGCIEKMKENQCAQELILKERELIISELTKKSKDYRLKVTQLQDQLMHLNSGKVNTKIVMNDMLVADSLDKKLLRHSVSLFRIGKSSMRTRTPCCSHRPKSASVLTREIELNTLAEPSNKRRPPTAPSQREHIRSKVKGAFFSTGLVQSEDRITNEKLDKNNFSQLRKISFGNTGVLLKPSVKLSTL